MGDLVEFLKYHYDPRNDLAHYQHSLDKVHNIIEHLSDSTGVIPDELLKTANREIAKFAGKTVGKHLIRYGLPASLGVGYLTDSPMTSVLSGGLVGIADNAQRVFRESSDNTK